MSKMEVLVDQRMPASVDAERAILGAILLDNTAFYQAESFLTAGDFSLDSHRRIFARMVELIKRDSPIDFVTLCEILGVNSAGQQKEIEAVGGVAYVTSLTDGLPRVKNIEQYVKIVRDKAMSRQLIHFSTSTLQQAYDQEEPVEQTVARAQDGLQRIVNDHYAEVSLDEVGRGAINRLDELRERKGECIGASTGQTDVDLATTGYREKEVSVIGGRPGQGKTAFMVQGIRRNLMRGMKVGCFSSEVPADQIFYRLACIETGIPVFNTRDPRELDPNEYRRLQEAIAFFASDFKDKFFIDDTPCIEANQLCARARAWASKGVEHLWMDNLQLMDAAREWKSEYLQVTNAITRLWYLARSTEQKVAAISHLKRLSSGNPEPTMSDLRASGAIEQFSQLILLLWREELYAADGETRIGFSGKDKIIIGKQRSGPANLTIQSRFKDDIGLWMQRYDGQSMAARA
jgi:replicative DNA helicase